MTAFDEIGYLVKRVQDALQRAMAIEMGEIGLSMSRYATLAALEDQPGSTNRDLATRAFVTPQSMSRLLRDLESDGLVVRRRSPASGREVRVELTPQGQDLLEDGHERADAVREQLLGDLDDRDRDVLRQLLGQLHANLTDSLTDSART